MSLPGVTVNVLDGNLGLQQGSNEQVNLLLGVCTKGEPDVLYSFGNKQAAVDALGTGSLVEAVCYVLQVGGGPVMVMPLNPDSRGALGSVTQAGAGATLTVSAAPPDSVTVTCITSGTIASGTAVFTFAVGDEVSAPVTAVAAWTTTGYRIPGTYTNYVFTSGTYVGAGGTADTYTISTAGVVAHATGAGPAAGTQASSPIDNYNVLVTVLTSGALGTGTFNFSLDNGEDELEGNGTTSAEIIIPVSGIYAIPDSGVVLTFVGTLSEDTTYTFKSAGPSCSSYTSALTALETTYLAQAQYAMVTVIQMPHSASGWGTDAATFETAAETLFNAGVFVRFLSEVPTVGSVWVTGSTLTVDTADTDSVLITQRASVSAGRVLAGAGDCLLVSPFTGLVLRRSACWVAAARASSVEASQNLGFVGLGGVTGVVKLFRNETASPGLDAAGYTTLRQINGVPGFYITDAHTCSLTTSDFYPFTNARVIDIACTISLANSLPLINSKIPTTTRNGNPGVITEKKAQQIESRINGALDTAMVSTQPQNAVATSAEVDRVHNIAADGDLIISVSVQPFFYSRTITLNIGMAVQA